MMKSAWKNIASWSCPGPRHGYHGFASDPRGLAQLCEANEGLDLGSVGCRCPLVSLRPNVMR